MKSVTPALIAFIGGLIAALIGTGIIFPPQEWSPEIVVTGGSDLVIELPEKDYYRNLFIKGEHTSVADVDGGKVSLSVAITINGGDPCNTPKGTPNVPGSRDVTVLASCLEKVDGGQPIIIRLVPHAESVGGTSSGGSKLTVSVKNKRTLFGRM